MSSIDPSQTAAEVKKAEISTRQEMDQQISSTAVNKERALISQLLKQTLSRLTEMACSVSIFKKLCLPPNKFFLESLLNFISRIKSFNINKATKSAVSCLKN